jgi:MarR-like DNA-binding transcriptional regulator SgrR of sgrS sRNA
MKRFAWQCLVVSSVLAGALAAAQTRPQYGGTLRVAMRAAPSSLDPVDRSQPDSAARRTMATLLYDTLITVDEQGRKKPALAESWQMLPRQRRAFKIRHGVRFHDGTPLTAEIVAASLLNANPTWSVTGEGDALVIESSSDPDVLTALTLPRNAIVKRDGDKLSGTGPFHVGDWQPGKKLTLAANEDYWRGRPFLDAIEIEMGRSFHDQMTALDLGKEELVEVAPEQAHRALQEHHSLIQSAPIILLALLFTREAASSEEQSLREALSMSVERGSIRSVLLQGTGEPASSILPTWISGYGFVFSIDTDRTKARQLRAQTHTAPAWTLGYDADDPLARVLAERIALNAHDVGLSLQPISSATTDLRLVEIALASSDGWMALREAVSQAGLPELQRKIGSVQDLYATEQATLATKRFIPLFHLPVSYASSPGLKHVTVRADGSLDLTDAWLENAKP